MTDLLDCIRTQGAALDEWTAAEEPCWDEAGVPVCISAAVADELWDGGGPVAWEHEGGARVHEAHDGHCMVSEAIAALRGELGAGDGLRFSFVGEDEGSRERVRVTLWTGGAA